MTLPILRRIPAWHKPFLYHIRNGKTEKVAANLSQVGTAVVAKSVENDPKFKAEYQEAWNNRKAPVSGGIG
jgi:hypothetical protein